MMSSITASMNAGFILAPFLNERLPGGSPTVHGVIIGVVGWLLMMVMVMPMGLMAPLMTLVLHPVFGAVLGWVYGKLLSDASGARLKHT